jgi:2-dehydropantoate 2-reductase
VNVLNVLVVGAGAIGSVFGGLLARAGHQVSLVGRQRHMAAIAERGLEIKGIWGEHKVTNLATFVSTMDIPHQRFDLILITTKSYDTEQAVRQVYPLVSPDSVVVSLQNGLGNVEAISEVIGPSRTLGGRVIFGVELRTPGQVEVTVYQDKVMLGSPTGAVPQERVEGIAKAFTGAGIPCEPTTEITKYIWGKVLYNCCLNALSALLECNYGELGERKETREIMSQVIAEAFIVAKRKGVALMWQGPQEYEQLLLDVLIPDTYAHHSSMLQDVRQGRRTEIDSMNGAIAKLGAEAGVETPTNLLLTRLMKAKEQRQIRLAATR